MSADNWRICPECLMVAETHQHNLAKEAQLAYGKVSSAEWEEMILKSRVNVDLDSTLREDYEIGTASTGKFFVHYKCRCEACGFSFEYKAVETLKVPNEGKQKVIYEEKS